jgi:hypothetical protein
MIDTLNIGKYIFSSLNNQCQNAKVYPLVADNNAKFPFVIYKRVNLISDGCKDGIYEDDVTVEITVVGDKYQQTIEIANTIRGILEKQYVVFDNMIINDAKISLATEEYSGGAFVQRMQFNFKINK